MKKGNDRDIVALIKESFSNFCNEKTSCDKCRYELTEEWCVYAYTRDLIDDAHKPKQEDK